MIFGRGAEKVYPLLDSGKKVGSWKARHYGAAKFPGEEIIYGRSWKRWKMRVMLPRRTHKDRPEMLAIGDLEFGTPDCAPSDLA